MFSSNNGILWPAEETLSGWVKRGWSSEWICIIVVGMVMPRTPVPPSGLNSNVDSVHKLATVASISILIATWDCLPKKDLYPASLTLPPVLYIKKPDVLGSCVWLVLSIRTSTVHLVLACLYACLYVCPFFISLSPRQVSWTKPHRIWWVGAIC